MLNSAIENDAATALLLEKGAIVNAVDKVSRCDRLSVSTVFLFELIALLQTGESTLMKSIANHNGFATSLLLEKGADLEATVEEVDHLLLKMTT